MSGNDNDKKTPALQDMYPFLPKEDYRELMIGQK